MNKVNGYIEVKLALGSVALAIGMFALVFALFSWAQPTSLSFGSYIRYICIVGSLGAIINGTLLLKESFTIRKAVALDKI